MDSICKLFYEWNFMILRKALVKDTMSDNADDASNRDWQ